MMKFNDDLAHIQKIIQNSEKNAWVLDHLLPLSYQFDINKTFIPTPNLEDKSGNTLFSDNESMFIGQLRAIEYTRIIHLVEEFIVAIALSNFSGKKHLPEDIRLLSRFIDEEVKHQLLFQRFGAMLKNQLRHEISIPEVSKEFSTQVMSKSPLSIWLLALHAEITTSFHYSEIFKSNSNIEPKFLEILKQHWIEESQHVQIDVLKIEELLRKMSIDEKNKALEDYIDLVELLDRTVGESADIIITNYALKGKSISVIQKTVLRKYLLTTQRDFFIFVAFKHPVITSIIEKINPDFSLHKLKERILYRI